MKTCITNYGGDKYRIRSNKTFKKTDNITFLIFFNYK